MKSSDKNTICLSGIFLLLLSLVVYTLFYSCRSEKSLAKVNTDTISYNPTPFSFKIPGFNGVLNIPKDNPTTLEGIKLGRYLFYDGRLSGNTNKHKLMSCATCHKQEHSFVCGLDNPRFKNGRPVGLHGEPTPTNMLPLINLVWNNNGYLWNGMISEDNKKLGSEKYHVPAREPFNYRNIESLVWMSIVASFELDGSIKKTVKTIQSVDMYPPMFKRAFGSDTVTIDRICKAIAQFVRSLISDNAKIDRFDRGEINLTPQETLGRRLFFSEEADCFHCHGMTPWYTTDEYYNNAKDSVYVKENDRYSITGKEYDKGAFRAPTLRNIAFTAPYMHDGRFKTLDQVLYFYNWKLKMTKYTHPLMLKAPQGGAHLSSYDLSALKAFLLTLSDSSFITNPAYSNPRPNDPYFIK